MRAYYSITCVQVGWCLSSLRVRRPHISRLSGASAAVRTPASYEEVTRAFCGAAFAFAAYDEHRAEEGVVRTVLRQGGQPWPAVGDAVGFVDDARTGTHAAIYEVPGALVVAFRGTEDLADVLTDLDARQTVALIDGKKVKVHAGIFRAWCSVRAELGTKLSVAAREAPLDKLTLVLTGHSLGGALATLAAAEHSRSGAWGEVSMLTYGAPRVGDTEFGTLLRAECDDALRVICSADVVPRLPRGLLANRLFDFRHCCRTIVLRDPRGAYALARRRAPLAFVATPEAAGDDPSAEYDPQYRGVFPLLDVRDWRRLPALARFALQEAKLLAKLLTGRAFSFHRERSYFSALESAVRRTTPASTTFATLQNSQQVLAPAAAKV